MGDVLHRYVHERLYLRLGEVAPVYTFGRVDISGKGIKGQTSVVSRYRNDVLQHNHVAPHGIGAAFFSVRKKYSKSLMNVRLSSFNGISSRL